MEDQGRGDEAKARQGINDFFQPPGLRAVGVEDEAIFPGDPQDGDDLGTREARSRARASCACVVRSRMMAWIFRPSATGSTTAR